MSYTFIKICKSCGFSFVDFHLAIISTFLLTYDHKVFKTLMKWIELIISQENTEREKKGRMPETKMLTKETFFNTR